MTQEMKNNLIAAIADIIDRIAAEDEPKEPQTASPCEMWTIAEAAEKVKGLSPHTIRQFVVQGKIPSVRTGVGRNGKILVPKNALLKYLNGENG